MGASRALDVAREHGLPESVLRRAEQYLLLDGQDMTAVIDRLNELAAQREKEVDALKAEQQRTREKRKAVQERFERERERLIAEVREVSATIMKDWQEGRAGHKQALKQLAKVRADLNVQPGQEENAAPVFDIADLKPGQTVLHRPWNKKAVVREVDVRQSRVKLDMNGVTLWADAGLLGPAEAPQQAAPKGGVLVRTTAGGKGCPFCVWTCAANARIRPLRNCRSIWIGLSCLGGRASRSCMAGAPGPCARKCTLFCAPSPASPRLRSLPKIRGGDGVTIVTFK